MKHTATLIAALILAATTMEAQSQWAVTNLSVNFMREKPDYTAELGDQVLMGTVVEISDRDSYWCKITSPEPYTAWVNEMGLTEMSTSEKDEYIAAEKYICTACFSSIREKPRNSARQISDFIMGDLVRVAFKDNGKIAKAPGWVKVILPSGKTGWAPKADVMDYRLWLDSRKLSSENVLDIAYRMLGTPYMWGGASVKGTDCSGLALMCYFMNGVLLPRNASQQAKVGMEVKPDKKNLQPGDLLFFGTPAGRQSKEKINHVGIYIGKGMYIHSSQLVRISSIDPNSDEYAGRTPIRARRIIGHVDSGEGIASMRRSPYYCAE